MKKTSTHTGGNEKTQTTGNREKIKVDSRGKTTYIEDSQRVKG